MIDDLAILLSTLLCLFVMFRAARRDRTEPWYEELNAAPRRAPSAEC